MPITLQELSSGKHKNYSLIENVLDTQYDSVTTAYDKPLYRNSYNSDNTTQVILPENKAKMGNYIPENYLQSIRSNYPPVTPQRDVSLEQADLKYSRTHPPVAGKTLYPPTNHAGVTPPMQDALHNDVNVEMREYYHVNQSGQSCVETLNHVMNCPMCSRYFKCDTKVYNVIIIMIIILFAVIMYFSYKEEMRRK